MADNNTKVEVHWEEPPAQTRAGRHTEFFNALRENPGRWARFPGSKSKDGAAAAIRQGKYAGIAQGEFEAVSRTVPGTDEKGTWVRFPEKAPKKASGRKAASGA